MKLILKKKPKNVSIVEGFPGFGLIGTIVTEYLLEHLSTEKIGVVEIDESPAMIAIHKGEIIESISIHYNKKYNLVIIDAINVKPEHSWKLAEIINELAKKLTAREIISLEGVGSPNKSSSRVFYYSTKGDKVKEKFKGKALPLMEGIIVGVTGALLSKNIKTPILALFGEAKSSLPDSKSAAEILKVFNFYMGIKLDPKPLMKQAKDFEEKLKGLVSKKRTVGKMSQKKSLSYVG